MHHHHGSQCVVENHHDYRQVPFDLVGSVVKDGILPQKIVADASSRKKKKARPRRHGVLDAVSTLSVPRFHSHIRGVLVSGNQVRARHNVPTELHLQLICSFFRPAPRGGEGIFGGSGSNFGTRACARGCQNSVVASSWREGSVLHSAWRSLAATSCHVT